MTGARPATLDDLRAWRNRYVAEVVDRIVPTLRDAGFRKIRLAWLRDMGQVAHCVQLRRVEKARPESVWFGLWFGVYVFGVGEVWSDERSDEKPSEVSAPLRVSPTELTGNRVNGTWDDRYPAGEEAARDTGEEIRAHLAEEALPWLDRFATAREVADYLVDPEPGPGRIRMGYREIPYNSLPLADAAACYLAAGDLEQARFWADMSVRAARDEALRARQQAFRDRLERLIAERSFPRPPRQRP